MLSGHWRKGKNYYRRADSAKTALQGAIDYTRTSKDAEYHSGAREGSSLVVPDLLEPIIGYRAWRVDSGGNLMSTGLFYYGHGGGWYPREPQASQCYYDKLLHYGHKTPQEHCNCGYYAASDFRNIMKGSGKYAAVGRVAMWGKIIQYTKGWRAEYAYPIEFKMIRSYYLGSRREARHRGRLVEENYGALFLGLTDWNNPKL